MHADFLNSDNSISQPRPLVAKQGMGTIYTRTYAQGLDDISRVDGSVQEDAWLWNRKYWLDIGERGDNNTVYTDRHFLDSVVQSSSDVVHKVHSHTNPNVDYCPPSPFDLATLLNTSPATKEKLMEFVVDSFGVWSYSWTESDSALFEESFRLASSGKYGKRYLGIIPGQLKLGFSQAYYDLCASFIHKQNVDSFDFDRDYRILKDGAAELSIAIDYKRR